MFNIGIVIPSFNESENLPILLAKIKKTSFKARVVIVDDSSKEENKKLLEKTKKTKAKIISRQQKLGRGSAVMAGFKELLKDKKIEYFFEMDADLSHNPEEFGRFLEKIKSKKADLVVGSRYIKTSKITNWPLQRYIQSRIINFFLRFFLGLKLTDFTNGFRLYSRRAVEFLINADLQTTGFILLSETAYKMKQNGFKITEVPISFSDRKYGKSSAGISELIASFVGIIKVRFS